MKSLSSNLLVVTLLFPLLIDAQGVWTQKADYLGAPRYYFIGYALYNKGYIGTGTYGGINSFLADWQEFDPVQNTWTQKAPLPMAFKGGLGFTAGNYGYATTGANDATFIFDTYEYNCVGDNWSTKATFDYTRLYATGIGSGTSGYIVGGYDMMALPMNDCWEYSQTANTWSQRANLPLSAARYYTTGFSVNGKVYVFGGTDGNNLLNDLWEFNPGSNTWSQKTSLPGEGRQEAMAFVINNIAYVVGGFPASAGTLKDFWKYDPAADLWTQLLDFPGTTGPAGGVGFTINDRGYVVCGNGTAGCWEYTPESTGMQDLVTSLAISVFPNPASGIIHVSMPTGVTGKSASIYGVTGEILIYNIPVSNSENDLDISNLLPGFYFIKVKTDSGILLNTSFIKTGD
jgi:N-acetylneuraminic acid mutarotase